MMHTYHLYRTRFAIIVACRDPLIVDQLLRIYNGSVTNAAKPIHTGDGLKGSVYMAYRDVSDGDGQYLRGLFYTHCTALRPK